MSTFSSGWYLIYTRPRLEKKVVEQLATRGVSCYLPMVRASRQWSDRKKILTTPLFPSYVFVYLRNTSEYFAGQQTDGVVNYVRFGKSVAMVREKVINNIRLVIDECDEIDVSSEYFRQGQQLIIQEGPLAGLSCEMVQYKGKDKALVRVDLLQRSLLVDIQSAMLKVEVESDELAAGMAIGRS
ncbi:UpxY family transcription antiterminator [Chitinophaga sp. Hz27]|uniref:UpxY family transcription antiterminator n=1 Tax=Chitinophaga sp. Hz27 TaxID=3347169 RepID=UPI0035DEF294